MLPNDMEELFTMQESNHTDTGRCFWNRSVRILEGLHKHCVAIM